MNSLNINDYRSGNVAVLSLHGGIRSGENNNELHNTLRFLDEKGERRILLNFADVDFIDSGGLGEVVAGFAALKLNGGDLKVTGLTGPVREIMEITGLAGLFEVYDEQAAVASILKFPRSAAPETIIRKFDEAVIS